MTEHISQKVLITGASGALGSALVDTIHNNSVLKRASSRAPFPPHTNVLTVSDVFTVKEPTAAFAGASLPSRTRQDVIINALSTEAITHDTLQFRFVDAAIASGVRRYVSSDFGSDHTNPAAQTVVPVFKAKGELTDYLKQRTAENDVTMTWTAIGTGSWMDWAFRKNFYKIDPEHRTAKIIDSDAHKFTATTLPNVALTTARLLRLPASAATTNRCLFFQDFTCSSRDMVGELERQTGVTWTLKHVSSEVEIPKVKEGMARGEASAMYDLILISLAGNSEVPLATLFEEAGLELANELVGGLPKVTLEDVIRDMLAKAK